MDRKNMIILFFCFFLSASSSTGTGGDVVSKGVKTDIVREWGLYKGQPTEVTGVRKRKAFISRMWLRSLAITQPRPVRHTPCKGPPPELAAILLA